MIKHNPCNTNLKAACDFVRDPGTNLPSFDDVVKKVPTINLPSVDDVVKRVPTTDDVVNAGNTVFTRFADAVRGLSSYVREKAHALINFNHQDRVPMTRGRPGIELPVRNQPPF